MRIVVNKEEAGERLDRVVAARLGLSRTQVRRLFAEGRVTRAGRSADKGRTTVAGDAFEVTAGDLDPTARPDPSVTFATPWVDAHLVVVDKPAGTPSHPLAAGELGCVANGLMAAFAEMLHIGYDPRQAGLVNRLDNDTSGLLLAARSRPSFERLRDMLRAGQVHKHYLALTSEPVALGIIDAALVSRGARVAVARAGEGEAARTEVLACQGLGERYLVEVAAPHAYRHQVRVHLAHVGAPLVGDALYGGAPGAHHHLHASRIAFVHPFTGEAVDVRSPCPWSG